MSLPAMPGGPTTASAEAVAALQATVDQLRDLVVSGPGSGGGPLGPGGRGGRGDRGSDPGEPARLDPETRDELVRDVAERVELRLLEEFERRGRRDGRSAF